MHRQLFHPHGLTRREGLVAAAALVLGAAAPARAQSYPARPVKLFVPFPPGGPVDTVGRALSMKLSELWGQQMVIDNRAGAGGVVGAEAAARSAPDGYTLFLCAIHHSVVPAFGQKLRYDIEKDFEPVSFGARFPVILVAHPSVPVKTVAELIALDKAKPGTLSFASSGNGGGTHLAGELFNMMAGTKLLHVPFKGSAPAMNDVVGGQVPLMFADAPSALPQIRGGKVRALAVCSPERSVLLPEVPTVAQSGVPGYEAYSWTALVAPAGTPKPIIQQLVTDTGRALNDAAVKQRLHDAGAEAAPGTPEQLRRFIAAELAKWGKVVRTANITPN